tara:strand:+ start:2270 stop:3502 length:1233 start_codon:yes stop_codon:yes gene_type:complete
MISAKLCIRCKGKLLCGLSSCPILEKQSFYSKAAPAIKGTSFSGSSPPSIFVSWKNYPKVSIAPLSPPILEDTSLLDDPEKWFGLSQERIIAMRQQLIRPNKRVAANEASNPSYSLVEMQELAMSIDPVAVEIDLKRRLSPNLSFDQGVAPMGPTGTLKNFSLQGNPNIPTKIDYLVSDTNAKSQTALMELYNSNIAVNSLHKLLSAGTLGVKKNRRLVPTRWAITAVDTNISKEIINEKVKHFQQIGSFELFHSNYLDNDFWVMLIPREWSFEQLECWLPGGGWASNAKTPTIMQDHEFYSGKKGYASNVEGAYYAARLAVAEHLTKRKRQAACVVFREIGAGYRVPLGVWQIRENVRHALKQKPLSFNSMSLALVFLARKLKIPIASYKRESKLIDYFEHQRSIKQWI